jgi:pimeloyl-ACP methyl ester carboxylesterase
MPPWSTLKPYAILAAIAAVGSAAVVALIAINQRRLIYFATHDAVQTPLRPWIVDGQLIGYCRPVENPRTVWLMTHGNGGQAAHRGYVLPHLSERDALYVLEYPGYGLRPGQPSSAAFNRAAADAFQILKRDFPQTPIGALGESIGSGPAASLAALPNPPAKIVLVVPFDTFASVAAGHMPFLPVRLLLQDNWDNVAALRDYAGPIDIFAASADEIIPFAHAKNLAARLPRAKLVELPGGHNDWSASARVRIEK